MAEHSAVSDSRFFHMAEKRTYRQRREYMLEAVKRRRAKVREMAVEYRGNFCHREHHAGKLQLSQATVIEKSDEFREAFIE